MTIVPIALSNKTNPARYKQGGSARLLNCYVETIGEEGKAPWAIYASDGLQGFASLDGATGGVRAQISVNGYLYVVAGTGFYRINSSGIVSLIGSMSIDASAPVYIERNRRSTPDIAVVCDGLMYYYRTTFQQVTDADLLAPTSLAFLDGYFLIGTADNKWQVGAIDDASAWDPLDFERADANPDAVVRVAALQRDAVIFGEVSTEFWRNTGNADFPFERVASIDLGCLAADSVATVEQRLAWVANDRTVRLLNGYDGQRISSHSVERDIEDLDDYSTIRATSWTKDGHTFYSISSPSWTWVYDTTTGNWHSRTSIVSGVLIDRWRVSKVTEFAGRLIAGDYQRGQVYEMGAEFGDEAGDPLIMDVTLPPVHAYPAPLTFHSIHIDAEKGVGTGQGASQDVDPVLVLKWSRDGGYTFSSERRLALGGQGQRTAEIKSYRLGQSTADGYVFRLQCSAKVVRALYQIQADVARDEA